MTKHLQIQSLHLCIGYVYVPQHDDIGKPFNLKHITTPGFSSAEKNNGMSHCYQGAAVYLQDIQPFDFSQKLMSLKLAASTAACSTWSYSAHELKRLAHLTKLQHLAWLAVSAHMSHTAS